MNVPNSTDAGPRIGSLCSGYGGLDMAVMDVLGGSMAWHCQYDPDDRHQYAARILEHHWPHIPNHGDITTTDWTQVEPVDVLTAGFPCQDLSYAGRGAGIKEGTRSGLWYSVADAVRALRPSLIVLENVRAIVSRRPGLDVVLASLAELGFDAEWCCLRASDVGAPHPRDRWFCLAWPAEDADGATCGQWRLTASRQAASGRSWADAGRRDRAPAAHTDGQHERPVKPGDRGGQPEAPAGNGGGAPADATSDGRHERRSKSARIERGPHAALGSPPAPADSDRGRLPRDQKCHLGAQAGLETPLGYDVGGRVLDWGQYADAILRWEPIVGRAAPAPVNDRGRLNPRFVEWMMGLPQGHVCDVPGLGYNAQTKALGNGVVPQQAAYALHLLLDRMGREVAA